MFKGLFFALGTVVLVSLLFNFLPVDRINWGRFSILPAATITVTGESQETSKNNVATYTATVTVTNANKDTATSSVNTKMTALIKAVKDFGIAEADIKTESVSVYQVSKPYVIQGDGSSGSTEPAAPAPEARTLIYPAPPQTANGDWQASNSITITLRDVNKASGLTDILNKSGATTVYGPNLGVDQLTQDETSLLSSAVADAKKKAESIARAGGQNVGRMINVQENGSSYPYPMYATKDAAVSAMPPVEPGVSTMYKTVTVTFELK